MPDGDALSEGDALPEGDALQVDNMDPVLAGVIRDHPDKVVGWMRDEPGCWGFLAGQAVAGCRKQVGRSLSEQERQMVWSRLWWILEDIKGRVAG